ncbi:hypothetical protein NLJ89_g6220 [Agrocybe chaxingu]|uniref:Uncharacterized protein n=1 Tax=Agrocybe chaxingu TaxID=84603 RepID=A0A9W8JZ64_9AGAR|nr:hypothetical protein NLJ89_g6220 [Agrocybe chaxingu]
MSLPSTSRSSTGGDARWNSAEKLFQERQAAAFRDRVQGKRQENRTQTPTGGDQDDVANSTSSGAVQWARSLVQERFGQDSQDMAMEYRGPEGENVTNNPGMRQEVIEEEEDDQANEGDDELEENPDDLVTVDTLSRTFERFERSLVKIVSKGFEKIATNVSQTLQGRVDEAPRPEVPVVLRPPTTRVGPKLTGFPARRAPDVNEKQRLIREHLTRLCGDGGASFATQEQASAYDAALRTGNAIPSCTAEEFRVCIDGNPKCAFNVSSARIFARSFAEFHHLDLSHSELQDIHNRVLTMFKTLKRTRKAGRLSEDARMRAKRAKRRYSRKYKLFGRRLEACLLHPGLLKHQRMISALGIDGMSSDESDYEEVRDNVPVRTRAPRYYVLRPKWRNPSLSAWLQTFDSVYSINRRIKMKRRGAYPRLRYDNTASVRKSSNPSFVTELPINAYEGDWLNARIDVDFTVKPTAEEYSFTHDDDIVRYIHDQVVNPEHGL